MDVSEYPIPAVLSESAQIIAVDRPCSGTPGGQVSTGPLRLVQIESESIGQWCGNWVPCFRVGSLE